MAYSKTITYQNPTSAKFDDRILGYISKFGLPEAKMENNTVINDNSKPYNCLLAEEFPHAVCFFLISQSTAYTLPTKQTEDIGNALMNGNIINPMQPIQDNIDNNIIISNEEELLRYNGIKMFGNITIVDDITLNCTCDITLKTSKNIIFEENASVILKGNAVLKLMAGIGDFECRGSECNSTVIFNNTKYPQIFVEGDGKVIIHYNPVPDQNEENGHKYYNPRVFANNVWPSFGHRVSYMLVNDVYDLQNIRVFLNGNYALSKNIDAVNTLKWDGGKGFSPISLKQDEDVIPFCGEFDGNGFYIKGLHIYRPLENDIGFFGSIVGSVVRNVEIKNVELRDINITGNAYVGGFSGEAFYTKFENISITGNSYIRGQKIIGGVVGYATEIETDININISNPINSFINANNTFGHYFGNIRDSIVHSNQNICNDTESPQAMHCSGLSENLFWE